MSPFGWKIVRQLGAGNGAIAYLAENFVDSKKYVIKLFSDQCEGTLEEKIIFSIISHESVLQYKGPVNLDELSFCNKKDEEFFRLYKPVEGYALEYTTRGDLLNLIQTLNIMPEIVARAYVFQLFDALEYLHSQGIVHRQLKLESLFLDDRLCLKLAGLEAAEIVSDGKMSTGKVGSEGYIAPEILLERAYDAFAADMFALGVIIFELACGISPFTQASLDQGEDEDGLYTLVKEERWEEFWTIHKKIYPQNPMLKRPCFKELIESLLCPHPQKRATLSEIRESKWMNLTRLDKLKVESWIVEIAKKQKSALFYSPS